MLFQGRTDLFFNLLGGIAGQSGAGLQQFREGIRADFISSIDNRAALPLHQRGVQLKDLILLDSLEIAETAVVFDFFFQPRGAENHIGIGHFQSVEVIGTTLHTLKNVGNTGIGHDGAAEHITGYRTALQIIEIARRGHCILRNNAVDVVQSDEDILGSSNTCIVTSLSSGESRRHLGI